MNCACLTCKWKGRYKEVFSLHHDADITVSDHTLHMCRELISFATFIGSRGYSFHFVPEATGTEKCEEMYARAQKKSVVECGIDSTMDICVC